MSKAHNSSGDNLLMSQLAPEGTGGTLLLQGGRQGFGAKAGPAGVHQPPPLPGDLSQTLHSRQIVGKREQL